MDYRVHILTPASCSECYTYQNALDKSSLWLTLPGLSKYRLFLLRLRIADRLQIIGDYL